MNILKIDTSIRQTGSKTRRLTEMLVKELMQRHPSVESISLDLSLDPPPHPTDDFVLAYQTLPSKRTALQQAILKKSDQYVKLMKDADILIFGVPMYNFSIPSTLKAFIDNIVRIDETFAFDGQSFSGLLQNKKSIFCSSRGGMYRDGPLKDLDHQEPYLRAVFGFMGVSDLEFINADGQDFGSEDWADRSMKDASARISEIVNVL